MRTETLRATSPFGDDEDGREPAVGLEQRADRHDGDALGLGIGHDDLRDQALHEARVGGIDGDFHLVGAGLGSAAAATSTTSAAKRRPG